VAFDGSSKRMVSSATSPKPTVDIIIIQHHLAYYHLRWPWWKLQENPANQNRTYENEQLPDLATEAS